MRCRLPSRHSREPVGVKSVMTCTHCGSVLRRLQRKGFLQRTVLPLFGYYPWECPYCREPLLLRRQYRRKKRKVSEPADAHQNSLSAAKPTAPQAANLQASQPSQPGILSPHPNAVQPRGANTF
jgi:hypothetical protein